MSESKLLNLVDNLDDAYNKWIESPSNNIPSPEMQAAIEELQFYNDSITSIDIDEEELLLKVRILLEEFRQWEKGEKYLRTGEPTASFWSAMNHVFKTRMKEDGFVFAKLETVKQLREQGVSNQQIATCIYGTRLDNGDYDGLFVTRHGVIKTDLLDQEAANPGSVVPPDYVCPYDQKRLKSWQSHNKRRLNLYSHLDKLQNVPDNPAPVPANDNAIFVDEEESTVPVENIEQINEIIDAALNDDMNLDCGELAERLGVTIQKVSSRKARLIKLSKLTA